MKREGDLQMKERRRDHSVCFRKQREGKHSQMVIQGRYLCGPTVGLIGWDEVESSFWGMARKIWEVVRTRLWSTLRHEVRVWTELYKQWGATEKFERIKSQ